jgi:hypothetical protein
MAGAEVTLSVAWLVALPMTLMVPVLLSADAITVVAALSELFPIWMKPLERAGDRERRAALAAGRVDVQLA